MTVVVMPAAADPAAVMMMVMVMAVPVVVAVMPAPCIIGVETMPSCVTGRGGNTADKAARQQQCQRYKEFF